MKEILLNYWQYIVAVFVSLLAIVSFVENRRNNKGRKYRDNFIKARPGKRRIGKPGYWYRCSHCFKWCARPDKKGHYFSKDVTMEVDHIKPWTLGGSDNLWNLQALCHYCNQTKKSNPSFIDEIKIIRNIFVHPLDTIFQSGFRKGVRHSRIAHAFGKGKRK